MKAFYRSEFKKKKKQKGGDDKVQIELEINEKNVP